MTNDLATAALRSIAGEALARPAHVLSVIEATGVTPATFVDPKLRRLFEGMSASLKRNPSAPLDAMLVIASVESTVPRELAVDIITGGEFGHLANRLEMLRASQTRRETIEVLRSAAKMLANNSAPIPQVIANLRTALDAVVTPGDTIRSLASEVVPALDRFEAARRGEGVGVLPTEIEALDALCGGLQPDVLTFIGSLPSVGKSALLASICRNLGRRRVPVGYLSLEDNRSWIVGRIASELSRVPFFLATNRPQDLTESQARRYTQAHEQAHSLLETVFGEDAEERPLTLPEVVSRATSMVMRHGCKALVIDHLGEVAVDRSERHDLDILEVVIALRSLAKAHHIPVVVAAHLRRRPGLMEKSDKPVLTDFAMSASIERVARVALGLYRPSAETLRVAVLKQTQGVADVEFDLEVNVGSATVKNEDRTGARAASAAIYADAEADR